MSKGTVNKVILIGNVGADPELRATQAGGQVANLRIATSESWKDKNTGQAQEKTEWHRVTAFGKLADIIGRYLRKGAKVYVEGKLVTRKWQDQSGADRYSTEIVADSLQMLDRRDAGQGQGSGYGQTPRGADGAPTASGGVDDYDDLVPF